MNEPKYINAEAFKRRIILYGIVHEGDSIQIPFYKRYFAEAYVAILRWVCEEIDDAPYAEVAPTQVGRWEDVEHAPNGLLYATCSVCGKRQTVETTNYCGNCGADMRGEEE